MTQSRVSHPCGASPSYLRHSSPFLIVIIQSPGYWNRSTLHEQALLQAQELAEQQDILRTKVDRLYQLRLTREKNIETPPVPEENNVLKYLDTINNNNTSRNK